MNVNEFLGRRNVPMGFTSLMGNKRRTMRYSLYGVVDELYKFRRKKIDGPDGKWPFWNLTAVSRPTHNPHGRPFRFFV